jgi:hypothetical protein
MTVYLSGTLTDGSPEPSTEHLGLFHFPAEYLASDHGAEWDSSS